MHQLIFYPDYRRANPYQSLLYQHVDAAFAISPGSIDDARAQLALQGRREREVIFHLHWEDAPLRAIKDAQEAERAARRFATELDRFVHAGGRLVWTKHNLRPHDFIHADLAEEISAIVAQYAETIIVHSPAAIGAVADHYRLDRSRFALQIHGNYRGHYPTVAREVARKALGIASDSRCVLLFGRLTSYKGGDLLIQALNDLPETSLHLLVVGKQPFGRLTIPEGLRGRSTIIDRFVDDQEVAHAFAAADGVALPYREILTSGTLLLALGAERPVILPRLPTLLDAAQEEMAFSYWPGQKESLGKALMAFADADAEHLSMMGQRGATYAVNHDWHMAGRQLSDMLHGLLSRRPMASFGRIDPSEEQRQQEPGYLRPLTHPKLDAAE